jgi:hypothetical protein
MKSLYDCVTASSSKRLSAESPEWFSESSVKSSAEAYSAFREARKTETNVSSRILKSSQSDQFSM